MTLLHIIAGTIALLAAILFGLMAWCWVFYRDIDEKTKWEGDP